jgi:hypothetical protein
MTMTVNSGLTAYCTPAQFVQILDYRVFAQLASDTDVPLASSSTLQSSNVLATCLRIGAGKIEMAVTRSAIYDHADLTALVTAPITNSGYALIDLNATLAAYEMFSRRFQAMPEFIAKKVEFAMNQLSELESGSKIFGFTETQQAGLIDDYQETAQDVANRNLPSFVARRLFGARDNVLPYGRNA